MQMNKRPLIIGVCLAAVCLFIFSYILDKKDLNLKWSEVQRITISAFPPRFEEFEIADEEQIRKVVDYLTSLTTIKTMKNPRDYVGGGYSIKIYLRDGNTRELSLSGNTFFMEVGKFTYEVPYNEAIKFDTIVANILEDNESKTKESSITGTVVSINSETSGRNISCVIKDKDNTVYNINLEQAKIIDATGNGWLILHKEDEVKVFYEKDKETDNGTINAITVYIKATVN
jgi:hypothetical protein